MIFARIRNNFVPMVCCTMSSKTEDAYLHVLGLVRQMRPTVNPSTVATDFEAAEMNAFQKLIPGVQHQACFAHFVRAVFRGVDEAGLHKRYAAEMGFAHQVTMISALAFVRIKDLPAAFEEDTYFIFYIRGLGCTYNRAQ
uniref:MULE transposase domain-containing protein n=1 Tax=Ditylenchus dipsaci TaxID=166011 RepID=A0A915EH71_9BILA